MTPERFQKAKAVFQEALEREPDARAAFLSEACGEDAELRRDVDSLLAFPDQVGLNRIVAEAMPTVPAGSGPTPSSGERSRPGITTALSAGARVGPYEVLELLGAGGMGEVYRARDERLRRDVAIKVLPAFFAQDTDRVRRFEREARAAAGLSHPNIMAIHDVGLHEGVPYLVAELLEGETLRSRLDKGALPVRKAIDYAIQIARGLTAAHEKGIVHRDLKPANLFLAKDGRVKILDFGLAKATRPERPEVLGSAALTAPPDTEAGMVLGTAGYMSPEQVLGQPVEARSDLFSFGSVLYEMLAGRHAFARKTPVEAMSAILNEDPPDLLATRADIPPALTRIVFHCLEKDPTERFQSARDLVFALEALSPISGDRLVAPALPKTPWKAAIPALAALLFGAGLFWAGTRLHPEEKAVTFRRITFRRGNVVSARFTPDGENIVYSASYDGNPMEVFLARVDGNDSRPLGLSAMQVLAVSRTGELALSEKKKENQMVFGGRGTLARMPLTGVGPPHEIVEDIWSADWGPGGELAVVRSAEKGCSLEYPLGRVILRDAAMIAFKLRVSPRGDRLAFMALGAGHNPEIRVTDLQGHMTTIATSLGVGHPVWSPDGNEVLFSADSSPGNSAIFAATLTGRRRTVLANTQELEMVDISKDGRVLVADHLPRRALVFGDVRSGRERDLSWLDGSSLVDLSEDASYVLFEEILHGKSPKGDVFLRKTDGSTPVRLGEGEPMAISPDGRWVLALTRDTPRKLVLHPTGTGELRAVSLSGLEPESAFFGPDSRRIAVVGKKEGKARVFLTDLEGHEAHPVGPDDPGGMLVFSSDGKNAVFKSKKSGWQIWPVDGGAPTDLSGIAQGEIVIQWSADRRFLYLVSHPFSSARVDRFEIATGRRQLWRELVPVDRAGLQRVEPPFVSRDGQHFAYSYTAAVKSDLYLLDGLQSKLW